MRHATQLLRAAALVALVSPSPARGEIFSSYQIIDDEGDWPFSEAWAITPSKVIAGTAGVGSSSYHGFVRLADGSFRHVTVPGARATSARAINGDGDVAGYFVDAAGVNHGYVWFVDEDAPRTIDMPGATSTQAFGISPGGVVVGTGVFGAVTRGFVLRGDPADPESFETVMVPGAASSGAIAINARGDLTGQYRLADGRTHGFVRRHGEYTTIDVPGSTFTSANGISATGVVVGPYLIGAVRHGYVWRDGVFTLVDLEGATMTHCAGITPAGEIVGYYLDAQGARHGFVLAGID